MADNKCKYEVVHKLSDKGRNIASYRKGPEILFLFLSLCLCIIAFLCSGTFSLYAALEACSDLLDDFGGHEMAAGITISENNIPAFARRFREYYFREIAGAPEPALEIDYEVVKPGLLTLDDLEALTALEPFGNGNPPPVLCLRGAVLTQLSAVGYGAHSRLRVSKNGESFDGICFCRAPETLPVKQGEMIDLAFEPQINVFRGRRSVQLMAIDIKPHLS